MLPLILVLIVLAGFLHIRQPQRGPTSEIPGTKSNRLPVEISSHQALPGSGRELVVGIRNTSSSFILVRIVITRAGGNAPKTSVSLLHPHLETQLGYGQDEAIAVGDRIQLISEGYAPSFYTVPQQGVFRDLNLTLTRGFAFLGDFFQGLPP